MAILRSLFLRRTTLSHLLRHRPLSSAAAAIPPSTPQWKRNSVRHKSASSKPTRGNSDGIYEDLSFNQNDVLDGYKFAYEDFKPRELDITEIDGCDLKHWLITIDFPEDPKPCPENMVRYYEKTVAKALNLSLEEAMKKIYACSTSNYTGFHVAVTEEESEKFRGKPGVVFILPDSYVDKDKKEYGGDKYINGIIIPRPRPTLEGEAREEPKKDKRELSLKRGPRPNRQDRTLIGRVPPTQLSQPREIPHPYSYPGPGHYSVPQNHHGFVPYQGNYYQDPSLPYGYPGPGNSTGYWQEQNGGAIGQGYHWPMEGYEQQHYWQGQPPLSEQPDYSESQSGYPFPNPNPNPYEQPPPNSGGGYQEGQELPMFYWRGPNF